MKENEILIYVESGNIFDNKFGQESIYNFFCTQQDNDKPLLKLNPTFAADYSTYIGEYLSTIESTNDNKSEMFIHQNTKYLFYHFNYHLHRQKTYYYTRRCR